ncbi:hypothetical protein XENTR_v10019015 [Xenopus tropicalis]|nr:hypothetical protein XENTR_v10019015 [Xenopus tropicalis]
MVIIFFSDDQKTCEKKEKTSKVTVYTVTIFLQPVSISIEDTPVRSEEPDKEKLESEADSEKEKSESFSEKSEKKNSDVRSKIVDNGLQRDYDLKSLLGTGGFAKVYLAKHKHTKETVAIKALKKEGITSTLDAERIHLEKNILELATREQNPFLVGLFASFQTEHHLCLAIDYCAGGDLYKQVEEGPFPQEKAVFYAGCIVLGLQFLHKNNIIHRDIKPENILIASDGYTKITDFGLAKKTETYGGITNTFCGTRYYMAPEIVKKDCHTKSVDWWALGIVIYEMIRGVPPFLGQKQIVLEKIKNEEPPYPSVLSVVAVSLIQGLLKKDPMERLGASDRDAEEVMESSFFKKLDFDALSEKKVTPPFIPQNKKQGCFERMFSRQKQVLMSDSEWKPALKLVEREFKDF